MDLGGQKRSELKVMWAFWDMLERNNFILWFMRNTGSTVLDPSGLHASLNHHWNS